MKFGWRRLLSMGTAVVLSLSLSVPALAAEETDGIAVQLDGVNVTFTDAVPEVQDQRTFLPFRAVFEAMGATVDWSGNTVTAVRGDTKVTMEVGSAQATVQTGDESRTVTMDVAPYVKNNRTYVPVRFAAEAFGCTVGWDQEAQTVLILDPEDLIGDATFEIINAAIAGQEQRTGNQATEGAFTMDLDMAGLDGASEQYSISGTVSGVSNETAADLTVTMDLSALAADMSAEELGVTASQAEAIQAYMEDILKDASAEMRMDLTAGTCYFNVPVLAEFFQDQGITENTWFSLDLSGMNLSELNTAQAVTMEEIIDGMLSGTLDNAVTAQSLAQVIKLYVGIFRDDAFTRSGNRYTSLYQEDLGDGLGTMTCKTTIDMDGDQLDEISMEFSFVSEEATMEVMVSASNSQMDMTIAMEDPATGVSMTMEAHMTTTDAARAPETGLPDGAQEVSLEALMAQMMSVEA